MDSSFEKLESDYYKALEILLRHLGNNSAASTRRAIPYSLEKSTEGLLKRSRCWIISGISGSGKTTITKLLDQRGFKRLPNVTTRLRRIGEQSSDCIFVDKPKFMQWLNADKLFHPHRRNKVWQAMRVQDIQKFERGRSLLYVDKSVAGALELVQAAPSVQASMFLCVLPPSFRELYRRISKREGVRKKSGEQHLSKNDILDRFFEEIKDIKKSFKLPYAYIVNDSLERVQKMLDGYAR